MTGSVFSLADYGVVFSGLLIESRTSVRLGQIGSGTIYEEEALATTNTPQRVQEMREVASTGILLPGVYEIDVRSSTLTIGVPSNGELLAESSYIVDLQFFPIDDPDPNCLTSDIDADGDVDLLDFAQFQQCFSGPGG